MIEDLGKLLPFPSGIEMHLDHVLQPFSLFPSLAHFQCPCEPHLEMPLGQPLQGKYRPAFLSHVPLASPDREATPESSSSIIVFVKEA